MDEMNIVIVFVLLVFWVACGCFGMAVGERRRAGLAGAIAGLLFGPVGVVVACLMDFRWQCPECKEPVSNGAFRCPHCNMGIKWHHGKDRPPIARLEL